MDQPKTATTAADGTLPGSRSPTAVKLDNLVRSKLRVNNPYDANEIAEGLQRFFPGAAQLTRMEEAGLPFYRMRAAAPQPSPVSGPATIEMQQARDDVAKDLDSLLAKSLLKDVHPELRGWQSAITTLIADGSEAAPLALDPGMRDRTFQSRRLLGDYARISRFVGALTPALNPDYRALAQSIDEVCGVMMVLMGDALANVGFSGGRFLLQAAASELQARRDAAISALRNLVGTTQQAYGQEDWPRGLQAYQQFMLRLDQSGNSDLRALFQEANLARLMDDLIAWVNVMNADGLRALGSIAVVQIQPMRRLISLGQYLVEPQSPPLAAFLIALNLFVETFTYSVSGYRLIYVSRPLILFYGLYGMSGPDDATKRLFNLIVARGNFAVMLDCYLACACDPDNVKWQILFDKLLYDIDRAIDAYSLGSMDSGEAEARASAIGYIVETFLCCQDLALVPPPPAPAAPATLGPLINAVIAAIPNDPDVIRISDQALRQQVINDATADVVLIGQQFPASILDGMPPAVADPVKAKPLLDSLRGILDAVLPAPRTPLVNALPNSFSAVPGAFRDIVQREMAMLEDVEEQWSNLLQTMAPSCYSTAGELEACRVLAAAARIVRMPLLRVQPSDIRIPADVATSLDGLVFRGRSQGGLVRRP